VQLNPKLIVSKVCVPVDNRLVVVVWLDWKMPVWAKKTPF